MCVRSQREERFSTFDAISIIPIRNSLFARFVSTIERRKNSIITALEIHYTRERMRTCVSTCVAKSRDNGIFMILILRHVTLLYLYSISCKIFRIIRGILTL